MVFCKESFPQTFAELDKVPPAVWSMAVITFADLFREATEEKKTRSSAASKSAVAEKRKHMMEDLKEISATKAALKPYVDEAVANANQMGAEASAERLAAQKKAEVTLAKLNVQFDPSLLQKPRGLNQLLDDLKGEIDATIDISQKTGVVDYTSEELIERNSLKKGLLLQPGKVVKANGAIISLVNPDNPGLLPVPDKGFLSDMAELLQTMDIKTVREQSETIGTSWGASASTSGAAFVGGGVGAWSASTRFHAAANLKRERESGTASSTLHFTKTQLAARYMCDFSLSSADYKLSTELQ